MTSQEQKYGTKMAQIKCMKKMQHVYYLDGNTFAWILGGNTQLVTVHAHKASYHGWDVQVLELASLI